jgi:dTDP-4-amino-4,6-dideoxygalactose transaminase
MMSNHGISRDAWKRYTSEGSLHWQLMFPGFKYNMTDVQASLGLHQMPRLEEFIRVRADYVEMYDKAFSDIPAIRPLARRPSMRSAHHLYIVLLQPEYLSITRDEFILALKAENIGIGVHFISMHLQPYYRDQRGMKPEDLPVAAAVSQQLLSLPLYPKMTNADVHDVIRAVQKLAKSYAKR